MEHSSEALFLLFVVFVAAQLGAEIAQRLKLPAVVGEITAGAIIGPQCLALMHITAPLEILSELGAVLLLFSVGLETSLAQLKEVGRRAMIVGTVGVIVPFGVGILWAEFRGYPAAKAAFIGAAFVATSAGITAKVLQELGVLGRVESRIILAAAVVDDILAMLLLGVVTAVAADKSVDVFGLILIAAQAVAFVVFIAVIGSRAMRRSSHILDLPLSPHSALTLSLALCMALALAASHIGLAGIIGAFLGGIVLAESKQHKLIETQLQPILAFVVPYFFVITGARVDLSVLSDLSAGTAVIVVTVIAFLSKVVGCGLGAWPLGRRAATIIGVGMTPRGEVGIIVAGLGLATGIMSTEVYSIIVAMSLLTSIIAPPILKILFKGETPLKAQL